MNSDEKKELGVGVFFLVLSIAYIFGTTTISTFTPFGNRGLDSRSIPLLIGILTCALACLHILLLLVKGHSRLFATSNENGGKVDEVCDPDQVACVDAPKGTAISRIDSVVPVKLVFSMVFLVVYVAAFRRIGFILSSTFFLMAESFLLVKAEERKKWRLFIILFSIGASVLVYFVFTKYLSLFLPRGVLG